MIKKGRVGTQLFAELKKKESKTGSDKRGRDKDKELQESLEILRSKLSPETLEAIKRNPEKMEEIIAGLRQRGLYEEGSDVELQKFVDKFVKKSLFRDRFN